MSEPGQYDAVPLPSSECKPVPHDFKIKLGKFHEIHTAFYNAYSELDIIYETLELYSHLAIFKRERNMVRDVMTEGLEPVKREFMRFTDPEVARVEKRLVSEPDKATRQDIFHAINRSILALQKLCYKEEIARNVG